MNIKCPRCGAMHNCNFCPNCGLQAPQPINTGYINQSSYEQPRDKMNGCLLAFIISAIIFTGLFILIILISFFAISNNVSDSNQKVENTSKTQSMITPTPSPVPTNETAKVDVLINASEYSRISYNDLLVLMGEPVSSEVWNNSVSSGTYKITIYSYDKDDIHYEFHVANDSVVRMTLYSSKSWNGTGSDFTYDGEKETLLLMFGVEKSDYAKVTVDSNYSYRISPVNDKIADFWVNEIDPNSMSFGMVKITYNVNYYE